MSNAFWAHKENHLCFCSHLNRIWKHYLTAKRWIYRHFHIHMVYSTHSVSSIIEKYLHFDEIDKYSAQSIISCTLLTELSTFEIKKTFNLIFHIKRYNVCSVFSKDIFIYYCYPFRENYILSCVTY